MGFFFLALFSIPFASYKKVRSLRPLRPQPMNFEFFSKHSLWISSKFSHKLFILHTTGITPCKKKKNGLVVAISPSKCMLSICIWRSKMSQHAINHSFGGTDSLLGKCNGLIGEGCERKTPFLGQFPVSANANQICTHFSGWFSN